MFRWPRCSSKARPARQVQADSKRLQLSDLRYRNGVASYLDLLDAQLNCSPPNRRWC